MFRLVTLALVCILTLTSCGDPDAWKHDPLARNALVEQIIADINRTEGTDLTLFDVAQAAHVICEELDRREAEQPDYWEHHARDLLFELVVLSQDEEAPPAVRIQAWDLLDAFHLAYYWCPQHETAISTAFDT